MTVSIPFAFAVENHSLPAGEYLVLTVNPERSIRIASADGKHSAIVNTLPNYASSPSENSRVVFHKYGDEYFLTQVRTVGQNVARNPLSTKRDGDRQQRRQARDKDRDRARARRRPLSFLMHLSPGRVCRRARFAGAHSSGP